MIRPLHFLVERFAKEQPASLAMPSSVSALLSTRMLRR